MPAKKPKTKKAEPKLQVQTPVTQIKIPARWQHHADRVKKLDTKIAAQEGLIEVAKEDELEEAA